MSAKTYQEFTFRTPDGDGAAVKPGQGEPWEVTLPSGAFRFHGSKTQVQKAIQDRLKIEKAP